MKKIYLFLFLMAFSTNLWAWPSDTGSGVVSANENIVRASLEATQVLQSDLLTNLYGVTILGGTSNYASFNSGGVLSFRNVVTSRDVVLFSNDEYLSWLTTNGNQRRVGISTDGYFTISSDTNIIGKLAVSSDSILAKVSASQVRVLSGGILSSSSDTSLVNVSASAAQVSGALKVSGQASFVGAVQILGSTVAGLPSVSSVGNAIALVTDGSSAADCTAGGGKFPNLCVSSGNATWIDL